VRKIKYLALFTFLVLTFPVFAFSYHILNNSTSTFSFVFLRWSSTPVNLRVDPGTLAGGGGQEIVVGACEVWNSVPNAQQLCGSLTNFSEDITVDNFQSMTSNSNGSIDVVFDETGEVVAALGLSPNSTLGVALVSRNVNNGEIRGVLIVLNGKILGNSNSDPLSTTTHEMGHSWGLAHIPIGGINNSNNVSGLEPIDTSAIPSMFPFNIPDDDEFGRTLEIDDKVGISVRYPSN